MILPEDYRDEMLKKGEKKRKYNIIDNSDGTKSFDDVTDYLQKGSKLGAKQINDITHEINFLLGVSGYSIVITFEEDLRGADFTVSSGNEKYSGVVPESLTTSVIVTKKNTKYKVSARGAKDEYVTTGEYYGQYEVGMKKSNIFGVMWDYANDSTELMRLTRENDPYHYVNTNIMEEPHPAVGTGSGSSPFDDYMPWKGMEEYNIVGNTGNVSFIKKGEQGFSRTEKDTYVYIPTFYYKVIDEPDKQKRYWYISNNPTKDFELHPGSNKYIGKYLMDSNCGVRSGALEWNNITIKTMRDTIRNVKGKDFGIENYQTYCAILNLYLNEFASFDSQKKIGLGIGDKNEHLANGSTDTMNYHTGTLTNDWKSGVLYRNIENLLGNFVQILDGMIYDHGKLYVCDWKNREKYGNSIEPEYQYLCNIGTSGGGYIKNFRYSQTAPYAFLAGKGGGTSSTFVTDNFYYADIMGSFWTGGYNKEKYVNGLFEFISFFWDYRNNSAACRSMYYPE